MYSFFGVSFRVTCTFSDANTSARATSSSVMPESTSRMASSSPPTIPMAAAISRPTASVPGIPTPRAFFRIFLLTFTCARSGILPSTARAFAAA